MSDALKIPFRGETILVAEDNDDHVFLIKRAFRHASFLNPLHFVCDGAEAIAYLNGDGKYANREEYPLPGLLLLDLKMPNKDGFEVMEWIREQPALQTLPIVVLTTSDRVVDVQRAYQLGASSFLTKPFDLRDFVRLATALKASVSGPATPPKGHPEAPDQIAPPPETSQAPPESPPLPPGPTTP